MINPYIQENILQQQKSNIIVELDYIGKCFIQHPTDEYLVNNEDMVSRLEELTPISSTSRYAKSHSKTGRF